MASSPTPTHATPTGPGLGDRRLIFVLGKGGVGKSVVSSTLAMMWASRGQRVIIAEVANQHRLSEVFATHDAPPNVATELAPNLWGISIDVDRSTQEYLASQIKIRPLVDLLVRSRAFHTFAAAAPGLAELVTLGKIWELAVALEGGHPIWDKVIVDCPATGHGIALLRTAGNVTELAAQGPVRDQAHRIEEVVMHPSATGIVVVARPEELPVSEAIDAITELRRDNFPVAATVMNALVKMRFSDEEARALADIVAADRVTDAALHGARAAHRRQVRAHGHLAHFTAATHLTPLILPDIGPGPITPARLGVLATQCAAQVNR